MTLIANFGSFLKPADVSKLQELERVYKNDDGVITKDEAQAMLRQVGSDGQVSAAEINYLKGALNSSSFDASAKAEISKFLNGSGSSVQSNWFGGTTTVGPTYTAQQIKETAQAYLNDDGKIDTGEAAALLRDAMRGGMSHDKVQVLQNLLRDPRVTAQAKQVLRETLKYFAGTPNVIHPPIHWHPPVVVNGGPSAPGTGTGTNTGPVQSPPPPPSTGTSGQPVVAGTGSLLDQIGKLPEKPAYPGADATDQQLLEFQQKMQSYNRAITMITQVLEMESEAKKSITQNFRA